MGVAQNLSTDSVRELPFPSGNRRANEKGGRSRRPSFKTGWGLPSTRHAPAELWRQKGRPKPLIYGHAETVCPD
jgi:hypothetical protein